SSNALFGALQATTASQIGLPEVLMVAANSSGGVVGKMISPQSIAVACAAVGLVGRESDLVRFTLKYSLIFTAIIGVIVTLQAYVLQWMVVASCHKRYPGLLPARWQPPRKPRFHRPGTAEAL